MGTPESASRSCQKHPHEGHGHKLNTYMLSGVKEFCIVDPEKRSVLVYGFKDCSIAECIAYRLGDTLRSYYFAGLAIPVNEIFE